MNKNYYVVTMTGDSPAEFDSPLWRKMHHQCGHGWQEVPVETPREEALGLAKAAFLAEQTNDPKSMYPDGCVALNTMAERKMKMVSFSGYWAEGLTEEEVAFLKNHELVVSVNETDWDPYEVEEEPTESANLETLGTSRLAWFAQRLRVEVELPSLREAVEALFKASFSACAAWENITFDAESTWGNMQLVGGWDDLVRFSLKNAAGSWNGGDVCVAGADFIQYETPNIAFLIERLEGESFRVTLGYHETVDGGAGETNESHFRPYAHDDSMLRKVSGSMLRDAVTAGWELKVPDGMAGFEFPSHEAVRAMHPERFETPEESQARVEAERAERRGQRGERGGRRERRPRGEHIVE